MRLAFACLLAAWGLPATPARACAVSEETNIVARHYDAIVVAVIEGAEDTGRPGFAQYPGWRPWRATARAASAVAGRADAPRYTFERTGPFHFCAHAEPVARPIVGQEWVLYLRRQSEGGGLAVAISYPLDLAQRFDPRLRRGR